MLYSSYSLILLIRNYGISHCWLSVLLGASRLLAKRPLKMDLRVPAVHHWQMTATFMFRLNGPTSAEGAGVQVQILAPIGIGGDRHGNKFRTSLHRGLQRSSKTLLRILHSPEKFRTFLFPYSWSLHFDCSSERIRHRQETIKNWLSSFLLSGHYAHKHEHRCELGISSVYFLTPYR